MNKDRFHPRGKVEIRVFRGGKFDPTSDKDYAKTMEYGETITLDTRVGQVSASLNRPRITCIQNQTLSRRTHTQFPGRPNVSKETRHPENLSPSHHRTAKYAKKSTEIFIATEDA